MWFCKITLHKDKIVALSCQRMITLSTFSILKRKFGITIYFSLKNRIHEKAYSFKICGKKKFWKKNCTSNEMHVFVRYQTRITEVNILQKTLDMFQMIDTVNVIRGIKDIWRYQVSEIPFTITNFLFFIVFS